MSTVVTPRLLGVVDMEICYLTGERAGSYLYEKADGEPVRDGRVVLGVGRVNFG